MSDKFHKTVKIIPNLRTEMEKVNKENAARKEENIVIRVKKKN